MRGLDWRNEKSRFIESERREYKEAWKKPALKEKKTNNDKKKTNNDKKKIRIR